MGLFEYESRYIRTGLDILETYLLSDRLFWDLHLHPNPGESPYPALTIGCLLLSLARLQALEITHQEQFELAKLENKLDHFRTQWRVIWKRKMEWEFRSRLNQWRNYLNDVSQNPEEYAVDYAYTVRLRVMLTLMQKDDLEVGSSNHEVLSALDRLVQTRFVFGDFCWEPELAGGFPQSVYWYLWGKLVE